MNDILLAVDCSLRLTSLAVAACEPEENGEMKILSELNADIGRKQAAELPSLTEVVISEARVEKQDITHIAVTIGPGYFTGVRIGMAWGAAFAFGIGAKVVPVGTLDALMLSCESKNPTILAVYAGKGYVYAHSLGFSKNIPVNQYSVAELLEWANSQKTPFTWYSDDPAKINFPPLTNIAVEKVFPAARNTAAVGWEERFEKSICPWDLRANWCRNPT